MKVLISAYSCDPNKGSEPGVGWNWIREISRFHQVWALTRGKNRDAIETALKNKPMPNVQWVYFDFPNWFRFWKKDRRGEHPYYYLWQFGALFLARRLHKRFSFELAHHVTFATYWMPSFIAFLSIPFVWGPVGGGESAPWAFWKSLSARGKLYELCRDLARYAGEMDPSVRLTARRSRLALASTKETEARLRALGCSSVEIYSQVALVPEEIVRLKAVDQNRCSGAIRFLSMGDLLHLKGFEFGLRAFAEVRAGLHTTEYWIVGDGPERSRLEALVRRLQVEDRVKFWGVLPRSEALKKLMECDVLVHPCLHDSGGFASVEAMAAGRPVICLDLGGPATQVTSETGFKVPAISPRQVVRDLAQAMSSLACDPALCARLGQAARQRVQDDFNWSKKGEQMTAFYREVAGVHSPSQPTHLISRGIE